MAAAEIRSVRFDFPVFLMQPGQLIEEQAGTLTPSYFELFCSFVTWPNNKNKQTNKKRTANILEGGFLDPGHASVFVVPLLEQRLLGFNPAHACRSGVVTWIWWNLRDRCCVRSLIFVLFSLYWASLTTSYYALLIISSAP